MARSKKTKRKQGTAIGVVLLIFAIVVGAIAFCGYTVYQLTMGSNILNGVRMGTVDLSDMSRQQARAALEEQYGGAVVGEVINIHVGGKDFSLSAEESGLQYDISDSVELAYAYGDHHSDEPLLAAAKWPFAVTPNTGMTKIAKRNHWPILDWSIDVPKR